MGRNSETSTISFIILTVIGVIRASDPDTLQDFCVADLAAGVAVNGYPCKDPQMVTAEDFLFSGLAVAANLTGNPVDAAPTFGFVKDWPALNALGLSLVRLDLNPGGVIMPHTHNLATEILFVLEGEIYTGFVANSDNPEHPNKLFAKVVKKGEAFIFPRGLLHFQLNNGTVPAASINVLNGQNPGIQLMSISLFGTGIDSKVLEKSFFLPPDSVANISAVLSQFVDIFH
ncbi:hypothetical protein Mapa_012522 [Marchantia paleacea]|nr:hypothetical protein Mapa_012522 [Marchantia paleacea]